MFKISIKKLVVAVVLIVLISGCHVILIGAYDDVTDQGLQKVQTEVSTLFVKMNKNIDDGRYRANSYDSLRDQLSNIEGEIKSLELRCKSLPKYRIITNQLETVHNNIVNLEGLTKTEIKDKKILVPGQLALEVQFSTMDSLQNVLKKQKNK